jgi:hypothetical protein
MDFLINSDTTRLNLSDNANKLDFLENSNITPNTNINQNGDLNFESFVLEDWTTSSSLSSVSTTQATFETSDSIFANNHFDFNPTTVTNPLSANVYNSDTDSGFIAVSSVGSSDSPHSSISTDDTTADKLNSPNSSSASSMADPNESIIQTQSPHADFLGPDSLILNNYILDSNAYEMISQPGSVDTTLVNPNQVIYDGSSQANFANTNLMVTDGSCFDESEFSKCPILFALFFRF